MRSILLFTMRGRLQAILTTATLAVLATVLAPFSYLSGAVLGLTALRNGFTEGVVVLVGASAVYGVVCLVLVQSLLPAMVMLLIIWVPTLVLASVLRTTSSQSLTLAFAGATAALGILVFRMVVGDSAAWWRDIFEQAVSRGIQGLKVETAPASMQALMQLLDVMAPLMTGLVAAAILFGAFAITLIARWFHAILDNPGGFGKEFRSLKLDRRVALVVVVMALTALFANDLTSGIGREILCVAIVLYVFHGIALVHGVVAQLGASIGWLFLLYILMVVAREPVLIVLSITGFADTWVNIRERIGSKAAS